MAINMQNGLFGLGGFSGGMPQMPQQMAGLYDPQAARRGKLKSVLTQTGLAMLGQGPSAMPINFGTSLGQGLMAGVKAGDETENQYRDMAYQTFKINQDAENQKYGRQRDAKEDDWRRTQFEYGQKRDGINDSWNMQQRNRQLQEWQQADAKKKQWDDFVSTLPPDQQELARLYPEKYAQQSLEEKFNTQSGGGYFGNPLPMETPDGQFSYGLAGKKGDAVQIPAPGGGKWIDPMQKAYMQAQGKAEGGAKGEALGQLPGAEVAAEFVKTKIDEIINDPALPSVLGYSSYLPEMLQSNEMIDLNARLGELSGDAFLQARQLLKGGGAITDFESQKAESAYSRLEKARRAGNKAVIIEAAKDFRDAIDMGLRKLKAQAGNPQAAPTTQGGGWQIEEVP